MGWSQFLTIIAQVLISAAVLFFLGAVATAIWKSERQR